MLVEAVMWSALPSSAQPGLAAAPGSLIR